MHTKLLCNGNSRVLESDCLFSGLHVSGRYYIYAKCTSRRLPSIFQIFLFTVLFGVVDLFPPQTCQNLKLLLNVRRRRRDFSLTFPSKLYFAVFCLLFQVNFQKGGVSIYHIVKTYICFNFCREKWAWKISPPHLAAANSIFIFSNIDSYHLLLCSFAAKMSKRTKLRSLQIDKQLEVPIPCRIIRVFSISNAFKEMLWGAEPEEGGS